LVVNFYIPHNRWAPLQAEEALGPISIPQGSRGVRDYQYFCGFELENMSIYEILPALDLTQSIHYEICIGMHKGVKFLISRRPLIGLVMRLGWRYRQKISSEA
jgi:hypothetical protein